MAAGTRASLTCTAALSSTPGIESMLYISKDMRSFGLRLEGGGVIATDEFYAKVLELDGYYPFVRY